MTAAVDEDLQADYCRVWMGGNENQHVDYPYRLVAADNLTDRVADVATHLMLDSSIKNDEIGNRDVIAKAEEYRPEYVIPADVIGDYEATQRKLEEFEALYAESDCEATVIWPIQPPHGDHLRAYADFFADKEWIAVGGVKNEAPETQLAAVRDARRVVGQSCNIHGLGMGTSATIVTAIRENPDLLDSFDVSTLETLPGRYGAIADATWTQHSVPLPQGDAVGKLNAKATEWMLSMLNFQLSENATAPFGMTDEDQQTLADWTTTDDVVDEAEQGPAMEEGAYRTPSEV